MRNLINFRLFLFSPARVVRALKFNTPPRWKHGKRLQSQFSVEKGIKYAARRTFIVGNKIAERETEIKNLLSRKISNETQLCVDAL